MVSEDANGYICDFTICTKKGPGDLLKGHVTLDSGCSRTTKPVIGLYKVQLLATGRYTLMNTVILN